MKSRNAQSILESLCKKTHRLLLRYLLKQTLLVALGMTLMVAELGIFLYFFFSLGKPFYQPSAWPVLFLQYLYV